MKNHDIATAGNGNETLLICPGERAALRFLAQAKPLSHLQAFGQPLLARWLEHLSVNGVRRVRILASDRPEQVRAMVGDGAQWGLVAEVIVEAHELTVEEARAKYRNVKALMVDHFPGLPEYPLFKSPAHWINGLRALFGHLATGTRGVREIKPGVWVSASARVSPDAELRAPCWIGPHTVVAGDTVIGPMAVLEDRVMVETGVSITNSAVAPETFVGRLAELKDSLVEGSLMINWRTGSCARVPDRGLMCPLGQRRGVFKPITFVSRIIAAGAMALTLPAGLAGMLWAKLRGQPVFRALTAVRPQPAGAGGAVTTITYHELGAGPAWLRAWPQLWSVVRGDFAWVGNRPLSPVEVAGLGNDFEKLWLAAPIGLISLAQAEGAETDHETRMWASLYATRSNWRLDLSILRRALVSATVRSISALF